MFTFSFSLAHAFMLLLESLTFVVFPKVIGKLGTDDFEAVKAGLRRYRGVYVTLAHGLIYTALILFPLILHFFPKYSESLTSMNLIALTILMDTCRSGYTELIIAHNREKYLSIVTLFALAVNIVIALVLVKVIHCPFSFVILAAMLTYVIFSLLVSREANRIVGDGACIKWAEVFPLRLFIPFALALAISLLQTEYLIFLPLLAYLLLNIRECRQIVGEAGRILSKPETVNL